MMFENSCGLNLRFSSVKSTGSAGKICGQVRHQAREAARQRASKAGRAASGGAKAGGEDISWVVHPRFFL
jgi:hypothetical protein